MAQIVGIFVGISTPTSAYFFELPNILERMWLFPPQPTFKLLITWLFLLFWRRRFCRHFAPSRARVQFAAETKWAQYLGASDDENLSAGISWLTFLFQLTEQ